MENSINRPRRPMRNYTPKRFSTAQVLGMHWPRFLGARYIVRARCIKLAKHITGLVLVYREPTGCSDPNDREKYPKSCEAARDVHSVQPNDSVERPATTVLPPQPAHAYMRAPCGHDEPRSVPKIC